MPKKNSGYTTISVTLPTADEVRAFQILAIVKAGKMLNQSEAIQLAIKLASEQFTKED